MQGTVLVLMALSGVGCHHKACNNYAPTMSGCYSGYESACYASYEPACYAEPVVMGGCYGSAQGCYSSSCYGSAAWSSCYGDMYDACYSVPALYRGHGHRHGGLFGCFKRKRCGVCNGGYDFNSCYGASVFGAYPPVTYGDTVYGASQIYSNGSGLNYSDAQVWGRGPVSVDSAPAAYTAPASGAAPVAAPPTAVPTTPPAVENAVPAPESVIPNAPAPESVIPDVPAPESVVPNIPTPEVSAPSVPSVPAAPTPNTP